MLKRLKRLSPALVLLVLAIWGGLVRYGGQKPLDQMAFDALYVAPAVVQPGPQKVFHLGHSLVSRTMPAMVAQLAGPGHSYESQLGWGTSLRAHWEPDEVIKGFDYENDNPSYRDAKEAVNSGEYDALVVTESVEIRDAIKYKESEKYLQLWARAAWDANPDIRVYLYETWHELNDPEGWLNRLDKDLVRYWEDQILRKALAYDGMAGAIYVIPAGQVLAKFVRAVEAQGGVGPIRDRNDLFNLNEDGTRDQIHINDLGAYLVALTHYAVLYQKSPVGLPYALKLADGSPAASPGPEAALLMQETVWQVVTGYARTGVPQSGQ